MVKKMVHDFEVSVNPIDSIRVFRKLVQHHGWEYNRTESSRLVDRFAIIMPMAQSTRTLGVTVTSGPLKGLNLTAWSEVRGTSGKIHCISWLFPGGFDVEENLDILQNWVYNVPRCPWKWTFGERSSVGYLLPNWHRSKKKFSKYGFDVRKGAWPNIPRNPIHLIDEEE